MTDRLHILERERERLEKALATDPHWVALLKACPNFVVGGAIQDVPEDIAAGLMANELFVAYARTMDALERLKQSTAAGAEAGDVEPPHPEAAAFRTRVNVKSTLPPETESQEAAEISVPRRQDDLTVIRRIDRKLAQALNAQGVFTFETIAGWDRHEVRRVRDALDLGKRIWRENWMEQAELLRSRVVDEQPIEETVVASVVDPEPQPQPQQVHTSSADEEPVLVAKTDEPSDDLTVLDTETVVPLVLVVDRAVEEAAPDEAVEPASTEVPAPPTVPTEGPHEVPAEMPTPPSASAEEPNEVAARSDAGVVEELVPRETFKVGKRPNRLPAPATRRFAYISGVSDGMAEALRSAGVMSLADIAAWSRADVKWFQAILGDDARISQDQWIEQAAVLAKGVWTCHALRVVNGETRLLVKPPMPIITSVGSGLKSDVVQLMDPPPVSALDDEDIASLEIATPIEPAAANLEPEAASATTFHLDRKEQFNPLRRLTTTIALDKIKRPLSEFDMPVLRAEPGRVLPPPLPKIAPKPASTPIQQVGPEVASQSAASTSTTETTSEDAVAALSSSDESVTELDKVDAIDDWDDAEALVIRRAEPVQMPTDMAQPESVSELLFERRELPEEPASQIEDDLDVAPWGDEAEVVIVPAADTPDTASEVDVVAPVAKNTVDRNQSQHDREPLDYSAEFAARRKQNSSDHDDDYSPDQVGYRDAVEEATVTIIRAEASETDAASIVPREIANDADAPDESVQRPKARRLGSRFLKALTGE